MPLPLFLRRLLERPPGRAALDRADDSVARARFERIVEIAADAIISVDERQRITLFNLGAEEIFGYDRAEVMGRSLALLLPERFRAAHEHHLRAFAEGPEAARRMGERREIAGLRKDGTEFPAEASISRLDSPAGAVLTVVLRDITERKRAEETQRFIADASGVLARSLDYEATLAQLARLALPRLADWCALDVVDEGPTPRRVQVAHRDPALDPLAQRLTAYPPDPARPHPAIAVIETGNTELVEIVTDEFLEAIARDPTHLGLMHELGARSMLVLPLTAGSRTLGSLSLFSAEARRYDADDLMVAEEIARRAAVAVDNARLYQEAKAAVAARDEVLGVVSHDLGNPLSAVLVSARVARRLIEAGDAPAAVAHIEGVRRSALQMERLIRDLLEIRRIDAGRLRLAARPESPADLLESGIAAMRPLAEERGVTLEQRIDPGLPDRVLADADRILQVFSNLVGNALRFTPDGGRVVVRAGPAANGAVAFGVEDTGPGIAAADLPHVFDRFWQAGREGGHGMGLGLAIAKGVVEAHGGTIEATSAEGRGSVFRFSLPGGGVDGQAPISPASNMVDSGLST